MKKILIAVIASALLLTACGQVNDNNVISESSVEAQTVQAADKHITEIEMYETGGEDGRDHHWRVYTENGKNILVFEDVRMVETKIYELSDDDYNEITGIDFSRYINKEDDNDGAFDAIYYNVVIRYDDDTEERSKASIPGLWRQFNHYLYECEPVG